MSRLVSRECEVALMGDDLHCVAFWEGSALGHITYRLVSVFYDSEMYEYASDVARLEDT